MATKKVIALDAGHGLNTAGKQTPDGIKEWTLNDGVRDRAAAKLLPYNVDLIFTDNNEGNVDESLASRLSMYTKAGVDAFVSIHHNALSATWSNATGVETYTDKNPTAADKKLAECVHKRLVANTGLKDRGIKQADFYVINQDRIPAILTEGGFMDGKNDYKYITSAAGQEAYAKAIAEGLIEFLGLTKETTTTTTTPKTLYRVRKTWADAKSQIGAFTNLDNAKKACKEGYSVFDDKGNVVYTVAKPTPAPAPAPTPAPAKKTVLEVAQEIVAGKGGWGNGDARKKNLAAAGYDPTEVQNKVNELMGKKTTTVKKKTATEVAKEIIAGKGNWGTGATRKARLTAAGYNAAEVQAIINKLLKK